MMEVDARQRRSALKRKKSLCHENPQLLVYGYLFLVVIVVGLAMWLPRTWNARVAAGIVAAVVMSIPIALGFREFVVRKGVVAQEHKEVGAARNQFDELCQKAGIKIERTVEGVDEVALLKIRPKLSFEDAANRFCPVPRWQVSEEATTT
jgi:hypothetical protein